VIDEPQRGFGAACFAGLGVAESEVVCFMDCDGSLDPADLPRVVALLDQGADLALGARRAGRGAWPFQARIANGSSARELRAAPVSRSRDNRADAGGSRQALLDLDLRDRRSGWPLEMVVKAVAAGWSVVDTPVPYAERQGRFEGHRNVRGTIQTIGDMGTILAPRNEGGEPEPLGQFGPLLPQCGDQRGPSARGDQAVSTSIASETRRTLTRGQGAPRRRPRSDRRPPRSPSSRI